MCRASRDTSQCKISFGSPLCLAQTALDVMRSARTDHIELAHNLSGGLAQPVFQNGRRTFAALAQSLQLALGDGAATIGNPSPCECLFIHAIAS
jgi:hypothetical protein